MMEYQADLLKTKAFLFKILNEKADQKAREWLKQQESNFKEEAPPRKLYLSFSTSSRFFKKEPLQLSSEELAEANNLRRGFKPDTWDLLQLARIYLLLLQASGESENWLKTLDMLFETADMHEQKTLYAALPLLPFPEALRSRAAEGIRTNITPVFDAIALHNPYPADFLEQDAWNQLVLKAVFLQRPLYKIYGADERANPVLAKMLLDYAHERWAAGRKVLPELWRFAGPFLNKESLNDLKRLVQQEEDPLEKEAALLACTMSQLPEARQLPDLYPEIKEKIQEGALNWKNIGERAAAKQ